MQAKLLLALYTALMMPGFVSAQAKTCADFEGVLQNDQVLPLIEFNQRIRSLKLYSDDSLKFFEDGANEDCEMLKDRRVGTVNVDHSVALPGGVVVKYGGKVTVVDGACVIRVRLVGCGK